MTTSITRRLTLLALTMMAGLFSLSSFAGDEEAAGPSLYERLG